MEKERQDSAKLQLARLLVNLEYLSENTNFYGSYLVGMRGDVRNLFSARGVNGWAASEYNLQMSHRKYLT